MRNALFLVLLISMVALSSSMPKTCRGRGCRNLRPSRPAPGRPRVPAVPGRPNKLPAAAVRRPPQVPKAPVTKQPVIEQDMVTDSDGKEVREPGVNGWLAEPTKAPLNLEAQARTEEPSKADKPGSCDAPKGFGIKCMVRLDQCTNDHHCPGTTKCCMVGDCGYLCVKPKPVSTGPKEVTKPVPPKKNKGNKVTTQIQGDLTTEASEISELVEAPEGAVKFEDIIDLPEGEEEQQPEQEQEQEQEEEMVEETTVEGEEQVKESKKKSGAPEEAKEIKKEEETIAKEVEKVLEAVEEEIELLIEEEVDVTTQVPSDDE